MHPNKTQNGGMVTQVGVPIPKNSQPYNFQHFLDHYVFAPWIKDGKKLVRLFKLYSGKFVLASVSFKNNPPTLVLKFRSKTKLTKEERKWLVDMLSWSFAVDESVKEFYDVICQKDPVLKAASKRMYGAHLRTDPYVFESVIGVILAQNVRFDRIYKMSELLCENFGQKAKFNGKTYHTFPTPERLAKAPIEKIRACKVGYRDKYIQALAQKIVQEGLDLDSLRQLDDTSEIREKLMELPGVGPYTADLVLAIGFRRPTFHLDLFTKEALQTFYFNGRKIGEKKLRDFVERRWGKWKHHAMLLLTTNTDVWSKDLNINFRLRSFARTPQ